MPFHTKLFGAAQEKEKIKAAPLIQRFQRVVQPAISPVTQARRPVTPEPAPTPKIDLAGAAKRVISPVLERGRAVAEKVGAMIESPELEAVGRGIREFGEKLPERVISGSRKMEEARKKGSLFGYEPSGLGVILPEGVKEFGARAIGDTLRGVGGAVEAAATGRGRREFIRQAVEELPKQIKEKRYYEALENPATLALLAVPDVTDVGRLFGKQALKKTAAKEGVETLARGGVKEVAMAPKESVQLVYDALYSGQDDAARELYSQLSKNYQLPSLESIGEQVRRGQDAELAEAKASMGSQFGEYEKVVNKFKSFLSMGAEKTSKKTKELFREHIPRSLFGVASDEVAADLGMSENALMAKIMEDVRGVAAGRAPQAVASFARNVKRAVAARVKIPKPIRTLYDSLPEEYKVTREVGGVFGYPTAVSAELSLAENLARKNRAAEAAAKADFNRWQTQTFKQEASRSLGQAVSTLAKSVGAGTVSPPAKNVEQLKDISGFMGGARDVYRNFAAVYGKRIDEVKRIVLDPFDAGKRRFVDMQEKWLNSLEANVINQGIKKGSPLSRAVQEFGEGDIDLATLQKQFPGEWQKVVAADGWFRGAYDELLDTVNRVRRTIYPTDPTKIIPRRQDYYRHFQEMARGLEGLRNVFDTPVGISSTLAGISEFTRPLSKWLSFAQRRMGDITTKDAVGGFLDYLPAAAYATHVDPQIGRFRALASELAEATAEGPLAGKLNNFIEFLQDFANDLSGKTNPFDRAIQKWFPGGRKTMKVLDWVNSRAKANLILGNASSSLAQVFNIPQGIGSAKQYSFFGMGQALKDVFIPNRAMDQSTFIKERYFSSMYDKLDTSLIDSIRNFAIWFARVGDEIGTKFIWNSHYAKAIAENIPDPIKYADDVTRNLVAGRGIGEVPLIQKSKIFQLVAPFQVEVGNLWHVMKDFVDKKDFAGLATLFVANYLMNRAAERVRGSAVVFDPINAMVEALGSLEEGGGLGEGIKKAGGRLAQEVVQNVPVGQTVAQALGQGEGRLGVPLTAQIAKGAVEAIGEGSWKEFADEMALVVPPFGGQQIKKVWQAFDLLARGKQTTPSGLTRFKAPTDIWGRAQALAFGPAAIPEAREYYKQRGVVSRAKERSKGEREDVNQVALEVDRTMRALVRNGAGQEELDKLFNQQTREVKEKLINLTKEEQRGVGAIEYDLKTTKVEERAGIIDREFKEMIGRGATQEEIDAKWGDYVNSGVITRDVAKEIDRIRSKPTQNNQSLFRRR